jgi:hypothetical protein
VVGPKPDLRSDNIRTEKTPHKEVEKTSLGGGKTSQRRRKDLTEEGERPHRGGREHRLFTLVHLYYLKVT